MVQSFLQILLYTLYNTMEKQNGIIHKFCVIGLIILVISIISINLFFYFN